MRRRLLRVRGERTTIVRMGIVCSRAVWLIIWVSRLFGCKLEVEVERKVEGSGTIERECAELMNCFVVLIEIGPYFANVSMSSSSCPL